GIFLLFSFDYQQAQVSGLHTRWLHYGLLCMVSLVTLVISVKMAGIFLLFSFDYQQAQVSGLHTRWLHYGLLCMVSL
ncbi:metal ABC transporter permease, partial [Escherichia coli]